MAFYARTDDAGNNFDGRCTFMVSGLTPAARYWTLTLYDLDGRLVANTIDRHGFTSEEIVRDTEGRFTITVAPRARPGNWLPTGGIERYVLVWRLYDTPIGVATRTTKEGADAGDRAKGLLMIRVLLWILGAILLGGIVHLATVLAMPRAATQDAYSRLRAADAGQRHGAACRRRRRKPPSCRSWIRRSPPRCAATTCPAARSSSMRR